MTPNLYDLNSAAAATVLPAHFYRPSRVIGNPDSNMDRQDRQDSCIGLERLLTSGTVLYRPKILLILSIHV